MLVSSTAKIVTALFMKNLISPTQCLSGNNISNKRDIIRKAIPIVKVRISKIETLFGLSHFDEIFNEKPLSYLFDLIPSLNHG